MMHILCVRYLIFFKILKDFLHQIIFVSLCVCVYLEHIPAQFETEIEFNLFLISKSCPQILCKI